MSTIEKLQLEQAAAKLRNTAADLRDLAPAVSMRASALARELELKIEAKR